MQRLHSGPLHTTNVNGIAKIGAARGFTYPWPLPNRARTSGLSGRPELQSRAASYEAMSISEGTKQPSLDLIPTAPVFGLACPICASTPFSVSRPTDAPLHCPRCQRTFNTDRDAGFVDLTLSSGARSAYNESQWGGVQIFRSPLVSYVYERGWRQGFAWAGFPGEQQEFDMAMDLLQPANGEILLDMSCGSGLFSRRFATSGRFKGVIAADYSESMLKQVRETFESSGSISDGSVLILRADVGRLPFPTASLSAIHAGAAIHCWPNPTAAMAEISRVLKPGGVFVASTFLKAAAPLGALFGDENVRFLNRLDPTSAGTGKNYRWWDESELRDLCQTVGLETFQCNRRLRFILFSVTKPVLPGIA